MMKLGWICLVLSIYLPCLMAKENPKETRQFMVRSAYCACRCCEDNQDICFRHESIPATFKCSESMCNEEFCQAWETAKCQKDCFCEVCKDQIEENDFHCASFRGIPEGCKCDPKMGCEFKQQTPPELNNGVKKVSKLVGKRECVIPCFCKKCKDSLPPQMYGDCLMTREQEEECDCTEIKCPSKSVLEGLKKVQEMRERTKGSDSAYTFSEELDQAMKPEKAKEVKCKMQCFCDTCSVGNTKIEASCEKMLPKPRLKDCNCKPGDVSCPSQDVDQHCKIYCFCKGCLKDPKMPETMKSSCKEMTKKEQACMCAEAEDCSMLANLPDMPPPKKEEPKKPKKGKLKPKKRDRDEL